MKQQTRFYISRKNPLTWIAAALSLASIVLQILALCLGEGAVISTVNIWFQKVLPMAVSLGFALQLVLEGETRFYRTSKPIFWACVYFGQAALDLHLHGGYALFGYMRYVVMCWVLYLLLYLIYRLTITGKIPVSYPLLFTLLVPLAILIYDLAMAGCTIPVWYRLVKISNIAMAGSAVVAVLAMRPFHGRGLPPDVGRPQGWPSYPYAQPDEHRRGLHHAHAQRCLQLHPDEAFRNLEGRALHPPEARGRHGVLRPSDACAAYSLYPLVAKSDINTYTADRLLAQ